MLGLSPPSRDNTCLSAKSNSLTIELYVSVHSRAKDVNKQKLNKLSLLSASSKPPGSACGITLGTMNTLATSSSKRIAVRFRPTEIKVPLTAYTVAQAFANLCSPSV